MGKVNLIPADPKRCQAEMPNGENFMTLGGGHKMVRCKNKPSHIATEKRADEYGQHGSMSLCPECLAVFSKQVGLDDVTLTALPVPDNAGDKPPQVGLD